MHHHEPERTDDDGADAWDTGFSHGDVQPTNILVRAHAASLDDPEFVLGDFDHMSSRRHLAPPNRIVPECLSQKYKGHDASLQRQWDDVVGLSMIIYGMLTGRTIDSRAESLRPQVAELEEIHREIDAVSAKRLVRTVQNMLDVDLPLAPVPIDHFLASAFPAATAPAENPDRG